MKQAIKISWWILFDVVILFAVLAGAVLFWAYGDKKPIPASFVTDLEEVFEKIDPNIKIFIGGGEVEFTSFSRGFGINLKNSYIQFDKNILASVPEIKLKIKLSDLLYGDIKFRSIHLEQPKFIISEKADANNIGPKTASEDLLNIYKGLVYKLFNTIDKKGKTIQVEKIDLTNAIFSFNNNKQYETWKINQADLRFFSLQNTTYLSTRILTELSGKKTEVTVNSRLLDKDRMMFKAQYTNLSSKVFSSFIDSLGWFNDLNPVLNGDASIVMEKEGTASSISLDSTINFDKPELEDAIIGFKGVLDIQPDEDKTLRPSIKAEVSLKDVNMKKLPSLWPEKYGSKVRADVMKNYTKGTFKNVVIKFDYVFQDSNLKDLLSEKFAIAGDIMNTDVIYNPAFPTLEKVDGKFYYDGDNINMDITKAFMGSMEFGDTKAYVSGLNDKVTILDLKGFAKGNVASLKPLLRAINKGRDKNFFYNTREISADAEINFNYKDNIKEGFDPKYLSLDTKAKLSKVVIKNAVTGINITADELNMSIDPSGLTIEGDAKLNEALSQVKVFLGFKSSGDLSLHLVTEVSSETIDKAAPGFSKFADGSLKVEFEYKSEDKRNYFAGKIDSINAKINFPYMAWNKPKGVFSSISLGGQYIAGKAVEVSNIQIVSDKEISTGNAIISISPEVADEIYFDRLTIGKNDAKIYFNHTRQKLPSSDKYYSLYKVKIDGKAFDASSIIDSSHNLSGESSALDFDMNVDKLYMDKDAAFNNVKSSFRCNVDKCINGSFSANIENGGSITATITPEDHDKPSGIRNFEIKTDNAGAIVNGLGFANNIEKGSMLISGKAGRLGPDISDGTIELDDFTITKAPVLTRLFSLASFTGILDVLTGSGVPMKKLKGKFMMQNNKLSLAKIRAFGNSLGLTMSGYIDLKNSEVNLSGAVTPSYSVNSFLGKIPLIGQIFSGREGEGLIATTYKMEGIYPNIDVRVNPLSMLTPGIIRNIWSDDDEGDFDVNPEQNKIPGKK